MPTTGVEPARPKEHYPLKVARLPIPPRGPEISGTNITPFSLPSQTFLALIRTVRDFTPNDTGHRFIFAGVLLSYTNAKGEWDLCLVGHFVFGGPKGMVHAKGPLLDGFGNGRRF